MVDTKIITLLTLVQTGSFTKAAKALNLTQPAVSHHIRLLEQDYKAKIFYKDKKELKPTPEGEILINYAKRIVALSDQAKQSIQDSKKSLRRLTVGITPTAEEHLVTQIFAGYSSEHPDTRVKILTDNIYNIYSKLNSYELDLGIVEGTIKNDDYTILLLDTDYLCLAVSPKHPFAKRESVRMDELKKEKFILRSPSAGTRQLFETHLLRHGESIQDFNVIIELDSVATIKELVSLNLGITVIAHSAIKEEEESGKVCIVPIENLNMIREINMIYHNDFLHKDILDDIRHYYNTWVVQKSNS